MRLLIVEDSEMVRQILVALLSNEDNIECLEATDGRHALEILRNTQVDLIVSDIMMPGMDGFKFFRELRESGNETPCTFMSGSSNFTPEQMTIISQSNGLLIKPFTHDAIKRFAEGIKKVLY